MSLLNIFQLELKKETKIMFLFTKEIADLLGKICKKAGLFQKEVTERMVIAQIWLFLYLALKKG